MVNLAGNTNRGDFYLFGTQTEYAADFPGYAQPDPSDAGITVNDASTGAPIFTAIFQQNGQTPPVTNAFIGNTAAHELGHWVDALEGAVMTGQEVIWPGAHSIFSANNETFAETFAADIGGYTDRVFPGTSNINYQSQDWYLQQGVGFQCSWNIIRTSGQSRIPPTSFPSGCPTS
jgi:hypothetical protein